MRRLLAFLVVCLIGPAIPADGQPSTNSIRLELSLLEPQENACRAYLTMENRTDIDLGAIRLDLFLFGADQTILRRVAVASRRIRPQQTRVLVFDVPEVACDRVGRMLLNGVLACQEHGGRLREDCEDMLRTSSRVRVPLVN